MTSSTPLASFWDHLHDLRTLIIQSVTTLVVSCLVAACFFPWCADSMHYPLLKASRGNPEILQGLVTTSPMGIFSVLIQICLLGGLAIALPIILLLIARFISPALTHKEKRLLVPLSLTAFGLFSLGAGFSYFWLLPATLAFAMDLNALFHFKLIWSAPHYYSLVVWMTLGIGLCFEFPLILFSLIATRLVSTTQLKSIRKHMLVGILIVGAAIIPGGDPISLILLAAPMYLAYELILILGKRFES